jgi:hypothetical protein
MLLKTRELNSIFSFFSNRLFLELSILKRINSKGVIQTEKLMIIPSKHIISSNISIFAVPQVTADTNGINPLI